MNSRTRIKICGLREPAHVEAAVLAGADALGFVFYAKSVRAVTLEQASALVELLPPFVTPVGLFVNADPNVIDAALRAIPQLLLQFHGDEAPAECERWGRPYLRALAVRPETNLLDCARRHPHAQALLLDAPVEGYGGGGKVFDWSLLKPSANSPVVLSGGLNADNVADGIRRVRPWAVDVSSGVEQTRGVKSPDLIRRFCAAVRAADAAQTTGLPPHENL
ncbi:phosphoribosylanthranilate isomerase [Inhella proteolytica]|uniref:N-(5'-phosphoribosyl)anthranilate isomerase n=1 Tax=Inhella proteolytica TaxID=2795029 RepID=A0A931IZ37_9BURK|nr:phosphoribosylanthranilate isomerase [Inhella proteolytica]MBH9576456.1 phosphoribosylanthranilate isomerase [Inhella proteolytica]